MPLDDVPGTVMPATTGPAQRRDRSCTARYPPPSNHGICEAGANPREKRPNVPGTWTSSPRRTSILPDYRVPARFGSVSLILAPSTVIMPCDSGPIWSPSVYCMGCSSFCRLQRPLRRRRMRATTSDWHEPLSGRPQRHLARPTHRAKWSPGSGISSRWAQEAQGS